MLDELKNISFPPFQDKSFLQIDCGEGLICGYAWFEGANEVIGLGVNDADLEKARASFPQCSFAKLSGNLAKILSQPKGFDIIFCSEYMGGLPPEDALPLFMKKLNRNGVLILRIEEKFLPSNDLQETGSPLSKTPDDCTNPFVPVLSRYVYKIMGKSGIPSITGESQSILHIKNKAPYAILLMGDSGSGKSTVSRNLFPNLPVISGDTLMMQLAALPPNSLKDKYPHLDEICSGPDHKLAVGGIMIQIFNSAAGKQYACLVAELAGGKDFVYDGIIHKNFQHVFIKQLEAPGYQVLKLDTPPPPDSPNELFKMARSESRKFQLYLEARGINS